MPAVRWLVLLIGSLWVSPAFAQDATAEAGAEAEAEAEAEPSGSGESLTSPSAELPEPEPPIAQPEPEPEPEPEPRMTVVEALGATPRLLRGDRLGLWIETGVTADGTQGRELFGWSTELGVRFRVADGFTMDAHWGVTLGETSVVGSDMIGGEDVPYDASVTRFEPGNPVLSGSFEDALGESAYLRIGLGVAVPTAGRAQPGADADGLAERAASELVHRGAMSMRGWWSPWRWAPERFGLFVPARIVARTDIVTIEGEGGVGVMIPVLGDRNVDPDVILQLAGGFGVEATEAFSLGLRANIVGGAAGVLLPDAVLSVEPWIRLAVGDVQLSTRGVVNITGADRVGSTAGPSWSILVAGGGAI